MKLSPAIPRHTTAPMLSAASLALVCTAGLVACGGGSGDTASGADAAAAAAPTVTATATVSSDQKTVELAARARDSAGAVVEDVDFVLDGVRLQADVARRGDDVVLSLPSDAAGSGAHALVAVARDAQGNQAASSQVAFTVPATSQDSGPAVSPAAAAATPADTVPPTLTGGAVTGQFGLVRLSTVARDNVGVDAIYFYVDGKSVGGITKATVDAARKPLLGVNGAPTSLILDTTDLPDGPHVFSARARDGSGNTSALQEVRFVLDSAKGLRETEPNESAATANAVAASATQLFGTLNGRAPGTPLLDKDYYKVSLPANGALRLDWLPYNLTRSTTDTLVVELEDAAGQVIAKGATFQDTQLSYRNGAQARDVYVKARVLTSQTTPRLRYLITLTR
ncbi:hypothetical protein [Mitsuaria sp. GD03876]|uniref:hypothetical protein n=1 Tax=Mitsuaria sp. GD03876 TaxID=2975399 RepID=UPI00244C4ACE|nr:hypothetical protein [Mitsuaria sp. GD03876]MDH0863473.1 hypothetical protein [Mitsuaria sp. GD03876]